MAKYANYQKLCDVLFVIFTLIWIVTRLGLFPFWIIKNTTIEAPQIVHIFPAYYFFNGLLLLLLVLHIFWTYLILKIAYNSLLVGKVSKTFQKYYSPSPKKFMKFFFLDGRRYSELFG